MTPIVVTVNAADGLLVLAEYVNDQLPLKLVAENSFPSALHFVLEQDGIPQTIRVVLKADGTWTMLAAVGTPK